MAYTRYVYNRINWVNKSDSLTTPLGKTNLNRMDGAIYDIANLLDVAYNDFDSSKLDKEEAGKLIVGMPTWDEKTGILKFQFYDGTEFLVDFNIEKIPVSFSMDSAGVITMVTADGTEWTADIGDVIPDYTFTDSGHIVFSKTKNEDGSYTVTAELKKNSITGDYLQPDYLSDITEQTSKAEASAREASGYADNAAFDAKLSQSYAVGGSGVRDGEDSDNSKYYSERSGNYKNQTQEIYENCIEIENAINKKLDMAEFDIDDDGNLIYTENSPFIFSVDNNGDLNWEVEQ